MNLMDRTQLSQLVEVNYQRRKQFETHFTYQILPVKTVYVNTDRLFSGEKKP